MNSFDKLSKTILRETINKFLMREFMQQSFDWDTFNHLLDTQGIVAAKKYCIQELGEPIGEGSSRIVFEIDDHTVLKLSLSKENIEQNLHEWNAFTSLRDNPLLPKIYAHSDDYIWLWCEKVLPCTHEDFEKILGIPYNLRGYNKSNPDYEPIGYDKYDNPTDLNYKIKDDEGDDDVLNFYRFMNWYADYTHDWEDLYSETEKATFREWLKHPWFQYLTELFEWQAQDEFFDDNFGIAIRNGKPTIVVLDIGWDYPQF